MILETLELLTDFLNDATYGVNAKLTTLTTMHSHAVPGALALIADETRNIHAALGQMPDNDADYPCLLVSQPDGGNELTAHANTCVRDGSVQVLIRHLTHNPSPEGGTRTTHYRFKAVQRCVEDWFRQADSFRKSSNGVGVQVCESMVLMPAWQAKDDKVVTGAMLLTFRARDTVIT